MNRLLSLSFVLGIALLPIYLWESGGVQISHMVLGFGCLIYFLREGFKVSLPEILLICLTLYIFTRESVAFMNNMQFKSLLPAIHILYNLIIFSIIKRWLSTCYGKKWLVYGVFGTLGIATIGVLLLGYQITVDAEGGRAIGTFNNPNQLGYFSVCLYSIVILLYYEKIFSKFLLLILIPITLFLAIASLSKAAIVSVGLSFFFLFIIVNQSKRLHFIGFIATLFILTITYYLTTEGYLNELAFFRRLMNIGEQEDDSLNGRGYYILAQAGIIELIFGFGSNQVKALQGFGVHSTIISIFVYYGILGGCIFVAFLIFWAKNIVKKFGWLCLLVIASPPMLYGLTHDGMRFTIFWILLGLSFSASRPEDFSTVYQNTRQSKI